MVITAILKQISIPNFNTKNLRTCSNIVFHHFFRKSNITRDISVQLASWSGRAGSGRVGPGRFTSEMDSVGENTYFLLYEPYFKYASFSKYSIVLFSHIPVQELSRFREESLRSASSPRFARNHLVG